MSVKNLPPQPRLNHLKDQAKALLQSVRRGEPEALSRLAAQNCAPENVGLAEAQFVVAREHGFAGWTALRRYVIEVIQGQSLSPSMRGLLEALQRGDAENAGFILAADPALATSRVFDQDSRGETLLHRHCSLWDEPVTDGHLDCFQLLIQAGADVSALSGASNQPIGPPLLVHSWMGQAPVVDLLLRAGANPNLAGNNGTRAIDTAAVHGHSDVVRLLLAAGARFELTHLILAGLESEIAGTLRQDSGVANRPLATVPKYHEVPRLPLLAAIQSPESNLWHPPIFQMLLDTGAEVNARDARGETPMARALSTNNQHALTELQVRCARPDLYAAIQLKDETLVSRIMSEDPSLIAKPESDGMTPLYAAALSGDISLVDSLLAAGADPNVECTRHWAKLTALHAAISERHEAMVHRLLRAGAGVNVSRFSVDEWWPAPLLLAVRFGTRAIVETLLAFGADPNGPDASFPGALGWTVAWGNSPELAKLLLEADADVRHPAHAGILHLAAEHGHGWAVELLLERGASPGWRDHAGLTARERAEMAGHASIVGMLRQ